MVTLMDRLLKLENLDLHLTPYRVLATGQDEGIACRGFDRPDYSGFQVGSATYCTCTPYTANTERESQTMGTPLLLHHSTATRRGERRGDEGGEKTTSSHKPAVVGGK